jgi:hypothetical protein
MEAGSGQVAKLMIQSETTYADGGYSEREEIVEMHDSALDAFEVANEVVGAGDGQTRHYDADGYRIDRDEDGATIKNFYRDSYATDVEVSNAKWLDESAVAE